MLSPKSHVYAQFRAVTSMISGRETTFISKPGIEDWEQVTPVEHLAASFVPIQPRTTTILFGPRHGALPAALALANPSATLTCLVSNWITIQSIHKTSTLNKIDNLNIHQYPIDPALVSLSYDTAIMFVPKGRNLARRWLLEIHKIIRPDGVLYLGGANDIGIQSIIKDALELFDKAEILGYKKGARIARISGKKEEVVFPDWARVQGITPGTWHEFVIKVGDNKISIRSLPGIFSADHLDGGTSLLLENIHVPENGRVLDIGCGYGIIGITAALKCASAQVEMIDVDLMSIAASTENIRLNSIVNARALASDLLSENTTGLYQLILSNPPFHAGKQTNYVISEALVEQAARCLAPGGEFALVANRFLRYDKLMENFFSRVTVKVQTNMFHIITGVR